MNKFKIKVVDRFGNTRNEIFETKDIAVNKFTLERLFLKEGDFILEVECINPIDDIEILTGKKHLITLMGSAIIASEAILKGSQDVIRQITCFRTENLLRKDKGHYFDIENNITIQLV